MRVDETKSKLKMVEKQSKVSETMERETDKEMMETERGTMIRRQTETDRDRQRQTETDRDRHRQTETETYRQRQKSFQQ